MQFGKTMTIDTSDLVKEYERVLCAGRKQIAKDWQLLPEKLQQWLLNTGKYNQRGVYVEKPEEEGDSSQVEHLEYQLGVVASCAESDMPGRDQKPAQIPSDALDDDVLRAVSSLLQHPYGQSKVFLRLALQAIRKHQMANLLMRMPTKKVIGTSGGVWLLIWSVISTIGLVLLPAFFGIALVSASSGDGLGTIGGLYAAGISVAVYKGIKNNVKAMEAPGSVDEQAYEAWYWLGHFGQYEWNVTGAGAKAKFEDMLRRGLPMPLIAIDVADSLARAQ